jgi:hypothetical protein
MSKARADHSATELADGRILVAGGTDTPSAETYSRTDNRWTATGPMNRARSGHRATRLSDGRVLVADGVNDGDVYNPKTNSWSATGAMDLPEESHTYIDDGGEYGGTDTYVSSPVIDGLAALASGDALAIFSWSETVVPGCPGVCGSTYTSTKVLRYRSSTNAWTEAANLPSPRAGSVATLLSNGRVLVTGGYYDDYYEPYTSADAEVYEPSVDEWYTRGSLQHPRTGHTATLLSDGRVLISGGHRACCSSGDLTASELYVPAEQVFHDSAPLPEERHDHEAVRLNDGKVMVVGGDTPASAPSRTAAVYSP